MKGPLKQAIIDGSAHVARALTAAFAEEVGADGFGANAGLAVEKAKALATSSPGGS